MVTVAVLGASGYTGALVAGVVHERGHRLVALGRDQRRLRDTTREAGARGAEVRVVDARDAQAVRSALDGVEVLISTVGPFTLLGRPVVDAAIAAGVHLVDVSGEQSHVRWVHDERDEAARRAQVGVVAGAGLTGMVGDLLADVAGRATGTPTEVHVTYAVLGPRGASSLSGGSRRTIAASLGQPVLARRGGRLVPERLGEQRRLAWFPRPLGPRHAVGVGGVEPITVPCHLDGPETVRTYVAAPGWQAELLQAVAAAAGRWGGVRRRLAGLLEARAGDPTPERRAATRWACVAEASGGLGVARAWAHGHDAYGVASHCAVVAAEALMASTAPRGALAPANLGDPAGILDELGVRTGVRWSVVRPP